MKRIFPFIVIVLLSVFSFGCGETVTPEQVESADQAAVSVAAPVATPEVFNIGDTVQMDSVVLTVNSVRVSKGGEIFEPKSGNVYVMIDSTVENIGAEAAGVSSMMMFNLVDSEGYSQDQSLSGDEKGSLDGEISPGRKMRGEICWEVPKTATGLELVFDASIWGSGQAIFKVGDVASLIQ